MTRSAALSDDVLQELVTDRPGPCVSLYLTTQPPGRGERQDRVRLRHLLEQVERELGAHGVLEDGLEQILGPLHAAIADDHTWSHPPCTLAFFSSPGYFTLIRGRACGAEEAVVGGRFHLRPLLALFAAPPRFYVLAVSANAVRLVQVDGEATRRVALAGVAGSLEEAMGDAQFYSELQAHSGGPARLGKRKLVVHGHGDRDEERQEKDLRRWFGQIARVLVDLRLDARAPRVLAATGETAALFAAVYQHPAMLPEPLLGSPDRQSDEELAARALPRVEAALEREREEELQRWRDQLGSGGAASGDVRLVLPAAHHGLVKSLFVPADGELWGRYDSATDVVEVHARRHSGDEDLLERVARETLHHGGRVFELQPEALDGAPVAALLER